MKIKNTHLKSLIFTVALVLSLILQSTIPTYAWNEDDPDNPFDSHSVVTFGIYKSESGQIEVSQPDYYFDHFKYGIAHSIYNFIYRKWGDNANFNFDVSILWDNIYEKLGSTFFEDLTSGFWLMDVFRVSEYDEVYTFAVVCNRAPNLQSNPQFDIRQNINEKLTVEFLPENYGCSFVFFEGGRIYSYAPYYINDNVSLNTPTIKTQLNEKLSFASLHNEMLDPNFRTFWFKITVNGFTGNVSNPTSIGWVKYYNSETLRGMCEDLGWGPEPVMIDFPVFVQSRNWYTSNFEPTDNHNYDSITFKLDRIEQNTNQYGDILVRDMEKSPIIISRYNDIPVPSPTPTPSPTPSPIYTATPTPLPHITLMPTQPPTSVSPIQGIETMFSLFTRKYDFNVMGVTVGIRPFFLFLGCFVVGSIITMIQGGNKS